MKGISSESPLPFCELGSERASLKDLQSTMLLSAPRGDSGLKAGLFSAIGQIHLKCTLLCAVLTVRWPSSRHRFAGPCIFTRRGNRHVGTRPIFSTWKHSIHMMFGLSTRFNTELFRFGWDVKKKTSSALMCWNNLMRTAAIRDKTLIFNIWQAAFRAACPLMGNCLKLSRCWWRPDNCAEMKSSKRTDLRTTSWQFKSEHKVGEIQNNKPQTHYPSNQYSTSAKQQSHIVHGNGSSLKQKITKNHQIIIFLSN